MMENSKGLLDKKRFESWDKERNHRLRNLSLKKTLKLEEALLSSVWEWRKKFFPDTPICLKNSLKKKI